MKKLFASAILLSLSFTAFADTADHYTIIVDAGSTGSRLHLFQYNTNASVPVINDIFSESTKPGLSSFANDPQDSGASLKTLFDDAVNTMQAKNIDPKTVQVNVLATAGMRLLTDAQQKAIYANVTNYIQNTYPQFTIGHIETIPGKMEGVYAWLDVNYLFGALNYNQFNKSSAGIIDMGGASTQIAFATTPDKAWKDDEISMTINGQPYTVFSKSFLKLGQDQARNTMNGNAKAWSCYPLAYFYNDNDIGDYNFDNCHQVYDDIITQRQVVQQVPAIAKGQQFVAFSGVYYAYNFFKVDATPDQASVESSIRQVCNTGWDQMKKDYPNVPEKYLSSYCANATYIDDLLYGTYQLSGNQITVLNQIHDTDIDWPLGALLYSLISPAK